MMKFMSIYFLIIFHAIFFANLSFAVINVSIFSKEQKQIIAQKDISQLINSLILHKQISFNNTESIIDFALQIKESNLTFEVLEPRIIRYLKTDKRIFTSLSKAIEREQTHIWRTKKLKELDHTGDAFIKNISNIKNLARQDKEKILNAYALCINVFRNKADRERWLKPKICEPIDSFSLHNHNNIEYVQTKLSSQPNAQSMAYADMLKESVQVARTENLNDFEKIKMAKCISEQSLNFFSPINHPLKTIYKTCQIFSRPPDQAFFDNTGICGNFSAIAYNIAKIIGLNNKIFVTNRYFHIYLEFYSNGHWYHSHPFNSTAYSCDVIKF